LDFQPEDLHDHEYHRHFTPRRPHLVEFRAGDGPQIRIPEGVCQALVADDSVVLTWTEDGNPLTAAIPRIEFDRFVTEGQIVLGHAEEDAADAPKKD